MVIWLTDWQVNIRVENRTALQVASYKGHQDIVVLLLNAGADSKMQDEDGDSAFHYAAYGFVYSFITLFMIIYQSLK